MFEPHDFVTRVITPDDFRSQTTGPGAVRGPAGVIVKVRVTATSGLPTTNMAESCSLKL